MHELATIFQQGADKLLENKLTLIEDEPSSPRMIQGNNVEHDNDKKWLFYRGRLNLNHYQNYHLTHPLHKKNYVCIKKIHHIDTLLVQKKTSQHHCTIGTKTNDRSFSSYV